MTLAVDKITTVGTISVNARDGFTARDVIVEFLKSPEGMRIMTKNIQNIYQDTTETLLPEPEFSIIKRFLRDTHCVYLVASDESDIPENAVIYSLDGVNWINIRRLEK